jgi:hypothetical protein
MVREFGCNNETAGSEVLGDGRGGDEYTTLCDTAFLSDKTLTFCTARLPLHFCKCITAHTFLTSVNDTVDRELPCVCKVVNDLELASRTLSFICVSRLCYLLLLCKSCDNILYIYKLRHDMKCYLLFFLPLYKFVQLSC